MSGEGSSEKVYGGASPDGLPPLREVIADNELRAKKSLGQNFILDLNLTRAIARLGGALDGKTVVEIGPGPGGLTRALFLEGAARVIAIERDERVREALSAIAARYPGRFDVHFGDALEADWTALLRPEDGKPVIAANLPYAIATMLLIGWLQSEPWPPWFSQMILMFQKEVAERIVAEPGNKAYGRLAVIAQWRCKTRIAMVLKKENFAPPPKIESAVVVFEPRDEPAPQCSVKVLGEVTAAAFGQRRKMLRSSLKSLTPFPELLLEKVGIKPTDRAENVPVEGFARLAAAFEGGK